MEDQIKVAFEKSKVGDKDERYEAYLYILKVTEEQVGLGIRGVGAVVRGLNG